jgi:DNA-directed RNA polymerase sigma subunit (sigma70/sigma32)
VTFLDTLPSWEAEIGKLRYGIGGPSFTEEQLASMFKVPKEKIDETLANIQRWLTRVDLMWVAQNFERKAANR